MPKNGYFAFCIFTTPQSGFHKDQMRSFVFKKLFLPTLAPCGKDVATPNPNQVQVFGLFVWKILPQFSAVNLYERD